MRAMILAAGLGTRMRPLSDQRAKPALPVRGVPVIATLLELLRRHGIREIAINLHHHADALQRLTEAHAPADVELHFSREPAPLGTGGALRRVASFLRESDPSWVLSGDMLLDLDLAALAARHRDRGDLATLVLRDDPRARRFGTIGLDAENTVRRIGCDFDLGGDSRCGVFLGVRCFAARAWDGLPDRERFEDLRDWLAPRLAAGARDVRGELLSAQACLWEPVGTPEEYLAVNFDPPPLSYLDLEARGRALGTRCERHVVIGAGADVEPGARLERVVVWENEHVPAGTRAKNAVFAAGRIHACGGDGARPEAAA